MRQHWLIGRLLERCGSPNNELFHYAFNGSILVVRIKFLCMYGNVGPVPGVFEHKDANIRKGIEQARI